MSDRSDQGLPQGVDGHSPSGTDNLRSGSFTSPVAVNTGPSDPVTPEVMASTTHSVQEENLLQDNDAAREGEGTHPSMGPRLKNMQCTDRFFF